MDVPVICTIVAKNYLAQARCLVDSFLTHHPEGQAFVLLVDRPDGYFDPSEERFITILAEDLGIKDFDLLALRYTVLELSTAVKPFFLEYLFEHYEYNALCYLDPDIYFYERIDEIWSKLESFAIVLVPHLMGPLDEDYLPNELTILRAGAYNLGFLGLSRHPQTKEFLRWWQDKMVKYCVVDFGQGLFVDQRWVDLVPARFSSTYIHRDPGCDVAYWNLYNRHIVYRDGGYTVNGQPLKFYHFSGFSPERPKQISKHQTRYTFKDLPVLNMLFDGYKACLYDHGYETVKGWPYSYDVRDGRVIRIPDVARALWRDMELDALTWASEEAERGVVMGMLDWLNQPVDQPKQGQALVTRLALAVYQRRPDLQRAFPDVLGRDRIPYVRWLVNTGKKELSLDDFFTEPMVSDLTRLSGSRDLLRQQGVKAGLYQTFANWLFRVGLGARIERLLGQRIVSGVRNFFTGSRVLRSASQPLPELGTPQVVQGAQDGQADQAGGQGQGVNVVGYLCDETGVGESARTTMRALHDQGYPVARTMVKSDTARKNDCSVMHFPKGHPHGVNLFYVNADQMNVVYEELGPSFFADKYNIAYWAWELDRFPDAWLDRFQHLDEIWVGSRFVQNTLAHVAPIPVIIMGVGIDKKSDTHINRAALGLPQTKFLFLFAFDMLSFIERKNPLGAIEAYRRAFGTHSKDTALVIKVTNLDRFPEHRAPLEKGVASVGGILIDGYLDRPELDGLFSACDAYVSLHRSEGFGMTIAESMCLGKPVIATSYSGNADYMNVNNSYPVKYDLIELTQDYGPYQKGGVWADPDLDHAAAQMRRVFEHPDQARLKGARAAADIAREYSHAAMGRKMVRRLALVAGLK